MAKIVQDRVVFLRDGGRTRIFHPGDEIPDHLDDLVQNGSAVLPDDYEEPEEEEPKLPEGHKNADEVDAGGESAQPEGEDEVPSSDEPAEDPDEDDDDLETAEDLDENYTVPQLRDLAEEEGADISGLSKKDELIEAILRNRADNS